MSLMRDTRLPSWVPADVVSGLDFGDLADVQAAVREKCAELARTLGAHVAVYKRTVVGKPSGLCHVYEAAELSGSELARISALELRHEALLFVAYRKPLRRRVSRE